MTPSGEQAAQRIWLVVPVKATSAGKSRLDLPEDDRRRVALALAQRTVSVAAQSTRLTGVIVVTSDRDVVAMAEAVDVRTEPDPSQGLNRACEHGIDVVRRLCPDGIAVVMVCDLPEVTCDVLDAFIDQVAQAGDQPLHVPDTSGHGTTAVSIPAGSDHTMLFGPGSARRFRTAGHRSTPDVDRRLRFDLDTLADLWALPLSASACTIGADEHHTGRLRTAQLLAPR